MNKNQKGQTLLFVIVAVTIAMAVGVAVSTRTISSLKRVARTDTSARVIAAAEGGIENLLGRNYSQLDSAIGGVDCESIGATPGPGDGTCYYIFSSNAPDTGETSSECTCVCNYCANESDGGCKAVMGVSTIDENQPEVKAALDLVPVEDVVEVGLCGEFQILCSSPIVCGDEAWCNSVGGSVSQTCTEKQLPESEIQDSGDLISSRAVVKVEKITFDEGDEFSFNLEPGLIKEVNLDTYSEGDIKICWDFNQSAIYYYSYNPDGEVLKGGIKPDSPPSYMNLSNRFEVEDDSESGYDKCKKVSLVDDSYGLRIKVLYNNSKVAVFPTSGSLSPQGYRFTSIGEIVTGSGSEEKATVIVQKSYPYAPDIFDYGIYTPSTLTGSN